VRTSGAVIHKRPNSKGILPRSALRAKPTKNEFAFPKNPLAEGPRRRPGYVAPLHVLNLTAAVVDEVVMPPVFHFESRGVALDSHFTHQTSPYQFPQVVAGRAT
jgi:membrane-anchored protein YejM (alkaline phosphatase superfamily)